MAFFVDQFDIYLPVLVLAAIPGYFQPAGLSASTSAILTALVFASTLITRPVGAAVFGHVADTSGRKKATLYATAGFAATTFLMALLPGAGSIGIWSIGLLIGLRAVNGVFLGGAYSAAVPLAMEWSPPARRGVVAGLILSASPAAYALLALITLLLQEILPSAGVDSAYARWGWRLPFLLGAALAVAVAIYHWRAATESITPRTRQADRSPLSELLFGRYRRQLLQTLILMTGVWLSNNMVSAVLPGLLRSRLQMSGPQVSLTMAIEAITLAVALPVYGALSQRFGRRPFYLWYGSAMILLGAPLYVVLMTVRPGLVATIALTALIGVTVLGTFGPVAAYLTERFPARIRGTGFGVSYSLALVAPAFYVFYLSGIDDLVAPHLAPALLVGAAGCCVVIGAAIGPETRDANLSRDQPIVESAA